MIEEEEEEADTSCFIEQSLKSSSVGLITKLNRGTCYKNCFEIAKNTSKEINAKSALTI